MRSVLAILAALVWASAAPAMTVLADTTSYASKGLNDCSGAFGRGFSNCVAPDGAVSVAKTDADGVVTEIGAGFPEVLAAMFSVSFDDAGRSSGGWSYDPCQACAAITGWVAKSGGGFVWFHTDPLTPVTGGSWFTLGGRELSHLTFYGAEGPFPHTPAEVPLPAGLWLLATGLAALGWVRRARRS